MPGSGGLFFRKKRAIPDPDGGLNAVEQGGRDQRGDSALQLHGRQLRFFPGWRSRFYRDPVDDRQSAAHIAEGYNDLAGICKTACKSTDVDLMGHQKKPGFRRFVEDHLKGCRGLGGAITPSCKEGVDRRHFHDVPELQKSGSVTRAAPLAGPDRIECHTGVTHGPADPPGLPPALFIQVALGRTVLQIKSGGIASARCQSMPHKRDHAGSCQRCHILCRCNARHDDDHK